MKVYGVFLLDTDGYTYSSCELQSLWKTSEAAESEKARLSTNLPEFNGDYREYEVVGYEVQE